MGHLRGVYLTYTLSSLNVCYPSLINNNKELPQFVSCKVTNTVLFKIRITDTSSSKHHGNQKTKDEPDGSDPVQREEEARDLCEEESSF